MPVDVFIVNKILNPASQVESEVFTMGRKRGNGCGGITRVKGRKKQYRVRITVRCYYDEDAGRMKQEIKDLGYFRTRQEAEAALVDYNRNPYDLSQKIRTFKDLYEAWYKSYDPGREESKAAKVLILAYKYCGALYDMKLEKIGVGHLKDCIEGAYKIVECGKNKGEKKYASVNVKYKMKTLFNYMFDYAYERNLVKENVARKFSSTKYKKEADKNRKEKKPFSDEEIEMLWQYKEENPFTDLILFGIYTGFRPSEIIELRMKNVFLDENKMIGGMKTEAGTNRQVPIHPRIKPIVEKRYMLEKDGIDSDGRLFNGVAGRQCTSLKYQQFYDEFCNIMNKLNMEHTGHEMRHTFITRAYQFRMNDGITKRIVGHSLKKDITEDVYRHVEFEDLYREICKIEGYDKES